MPERRGRTTHTFGGDGCDTRGVGTGEVSDVSRLLPPAALPMLEPPQPEALPIELARPIGDSMLVLLLLLLSLGGPPKLPVRRG